MQTRAQPIRYDLLRDLSVSAVAAGFVTVLVGFASSAAIVFQAAQSLGATPAQVASWMLALGIGMGVTGVALSLRYRVPLAMAWSTSGAAMLITSAAGVSMREAIGCFLVTGAAIAVVGFTGWFERAINKIPVTIAAGMLSGVLLRFGLEAFAAMKTEFAMTLGMFLSYLLARRLLPRYAVILALAVGTLIASARGTMRLGDVHFALAHPVFVAPSLSLHAPVGVALPLFVVTMASQNIPGVAVLRASGYAAPVSSLVGWTGAATLVLAPFGGYALNLAAITAAICTGREAHDDPDKRYVAAMAAGVLYLVVGLLGATVSSLFAAFPKELVLGIAGLALFGTIGGGLANALRDDGEREPALITFLVSASGLSLFGVGSAFWGLLAGILALLALRRPRASG
jgi:benzoate membrane transport protein